MRGSFERPGDDDGQRDEVEAGDTGADTGAEQKPLRLTWPEAVCGRIQPLLEPFHDGALGAADDRFVREHVASCAGCAARLRRYDEIDAVLRYAPAPRVGPELRTRLYTRIAATQQRRGIFGVQGMGRKQVGTQDAHERRSYWGAGRRSPAPRGVSASGRPGLITSWLNGVAAVAVVALLALLFNTLAGMPNRAGTPSQPTIKGQVIGTLDSLPKFSDYRAAFLDSQGMLRIVSADGEPVFRITQPGPLLPNTGLLRRVPAAPYYDVAVSQDGHYLAYVEGDEGVSAATTALPDGGPVAIVNLLTGKIVSLPVTTNDLSWSPDNRFLVATDVNNDSADINIIDAGAGSVRTLTPSFNGTQAFVPLVAGWIDAAHVAVFYQQGVGTPTPTMLTPTATPTAPATSTVSPTPSPSATPPAESVRQRLGSMDTNSGAIAYLAGLPDPSDVFLSPDGQEALLASNFSTSMAQVVDTKTGYKRSLPNIAATFAGRFRDLGNGSNWSLHSAWQPGAGHVLAVSLSIGNGNLASRQESGVWLLDLDSDSARQVLPGKYPLAWFPAPSQALVTCDPPDPDSSDAYPRDGAGVGTNVYAFSPVTQDGDVMPLAGGMVAFLGLVRTQ